MFPESQKKRVPLVRGRPVTKEEVIRVVMNEVPEYRKTTPTTWEWTEPGEFEWKFFDSEKQKMVKFLVDQKGLQREVEATVFKDRWEQILSTLLNFRKVFLIIPTREIIVT